MLFSDVNVGYNCTLQYESEMIGKPTIFYQSKEQLFDELNHIKEPTNSPIQDFNATDKCVDFIQHLLNSMTPRAFH